MSPYQRWEQSVQKETIYAFLELDDGSNPRLLGSFEMDPDAPCDVMREYMERKLRDALNDCVGEDFCFFLQGPGGGTVLARKLEVRSWGKLYAPLKPLPAGTVVNDSQSNSSQPIMRRVVTIVKDKSLIREEPSMIPEFARDNEETPMVPS